MRGGMSAGYFLSHFKVEMHRRLNDSHVRRVAILEWVPAAFHSSLEDCSDLAPQVRGFRVASERGGSLDYTTYKDAEVPGSLSGSEVGFIMAAAARSSVREANSMRHF